MTISDLKSKVQNATGQLDDSRMDLVLQMAIAEVWFFSDVPGSLWQMFAKRAPKNHITLPPEVHMIRAIREVAGHNVEINSPSPYYQEDQITSDFSWHEIGATPLMQTISNAAPLTITLQRTEDADVTFYLTGPTQLAARATEDVVISAGDVTAITVNAYTDLISLHKSSVTKADVLIQDAEGNTVARMLNFREDCLCHKYRISPVCNDLTGNTCLDILYKPHAPSSDQIHSAFPYPFDTALLWKTIEIVKVVEKLDIGMLAQKASALLTEVTAAARSGKVRKIPTKMMAGRIYHGDF